VKKSSKYSKPFAVQVERSWNQAHAPLLVKRFPNKPTESQASQFNGSHTYKTNKQTS